MIAGSDSAARLVGLGRRRSDRHDRLIPMVNLVFLLLIFFLIAGTFRAADALKVTPPEAVSEGQFDPGALTLIVASNGDMALGGERIDPASAAVLVRQWLDANPGGDIQIKADRETPVSVIVPLLGDLATQKIENIRLISLQGAGKR